MSSELREFMYSTSVQSFNKLKAHIGEKITVIFNKVTDPKLPPSSAIATGVLANVKDFDCVQFSTGSSIPFIDNNNIIREIFVNETKENLYDKTLVVNNSTKVMNNLAKYRVLLFGKENPLAQAQNRTISDNFANSKSLL